MPCLGQRLPQNAHDTQLSAQHPQPLSTVTTLQPIWSPSHELNRAPLYHCLEVLHSVPFHTSGVTRDSKAKRNPGGDCCAQTSSLSPRLQPMVLNSTIFVRAGITCTLSTLIQYLSDCECRSERMVQLCRPSYMAPVMYTYGTSPFFHPSVQCLSQDARA